MTKTDGKTCIFRFVLKVALMSCLIIQNISRRRNYYRLEESVTAKKKKNLDISLPARL